MKERGGDGVDRGDGGDVSGFDGDLLDGGVDFNTNLLAEHGEILLGLFYLHGLHGQLAVNLLES